MYSIIFSCIINFIEEEVMDEIKRIFTIEKLQYVCVAQEFDNNNTTNQTSRLHVQIILKQIINKKTWFLDSITGKVSFYMEYVKINSFKHILLLLLL